MEANPRSERLLSLNTLARKLDVSYPRALDLFKRGVLKPDFTADRISLFRPERIPTLRQHIRDAQ